MIKVARWVCQSWVYASAIIVVARYWIGTAATTASSTASASVAISSSGLYLISNSRRYVVEIKLTVDYGVHCGYDRITLSLCQ
jgi:hypothetical protein